MARASCADSACLTRALVQRDGARLLAPGRRHAPVQPPEVGEQGLGDGLPERVGRPAERRARLGHVVLQEPGLGEQDAHPELVFAGERGGPEHLGEVLRGFGGLAPLECRLGSRHGWLQGHADHERSIHAACTRAGMAGQIAQRAG